jgi:NAD(P)-dependent dehydrogenase (short-subunit alcohol dehydrogenase family)
MRGRVCVVTGASSGIGFETARGLAAAGARVLMICRDRERGEAAMLRIRAEHEGADLELFLADLSSMDDLWRVAAELQGRHPRIHVLVNNAGALFGRRILSADGIEMNFALNHLSYFILTNLLMETLVASSPARVVNVASNAHRAGRIDWDDIQMERGYGGFQAYRNSKLMNLLFTFELARRLAKRGVTANCLHPGVVWTGIARQGRLHERLIWGVIRPFMIDAEKGAVGALRLASATELEKVSGNYFDQVTEAVPTSAAQDLDAAARLWAISRKITRLG